MGLKRNQDRYLMIGSDKGKSRGSMTSVTIENFKGVGEESVTVPVRPLTLLYGLNGSGKSMVLDALDYFFSMTSLFSGLSREMFRSLVHRYELDRQIRIRVKSVLNDFGDPMELWSEVVTKWVERDQDYLEGYGKVSSSLGVVLKTGEEVCFYFNFDKKKINELMGETGKLTYWKDIMNKGLNVIIDTWYDQGFGCNRYDQYVRSVAV